MILLSHKIFLLVHKYFMKKVVAMLPSRLFSLSFWPRLRARCRDGEGVRAMSGGEVPEGVLLGIGNPLLDMSFSADTHFINKYSLPEDGQVEASSQHDTLFHDVIENHAPHYLPGGATMNSVRVAQWLLRRPFATSFVGGVGQDSAAEKLRERATEVGVKVVFDVHPDTPTGVCLAIINGENRTLVSQLGAAQLFNSHFFDSQQHTALLEKAQFFYIGGFFVPVSPETVCSIAQHSTEHGKRLIMNLHAPFACAYFADPKLGLLQHVDFLFGNATEAQTLSNHLGLGASSLEDIAARVRDQPTANEARTRVVVFTNGRKPTVVASDSGVLTYPIAKIDPSEIKDTNGCGDAFVGGFLSQLARGRSLEDCLRCGNYAASEKIKFSGCNFPQTPHFE